MDSKETYETCAAIAAALSTAKRQVFADALIRLVAGRAPIMGTLPALSRWLPETVRPMLLPLVANVRTRQDAPRNAARRWLRDAGWL